MDVSPLQLQHYFFTAFSVLTLPKALAETVVRSGPYVANEHLELKVDLALGELKGEEDEHRRFMVRLLVRGQPKKDTAYPYRFGAGVEGVFTIDHDGDMEERKRLVLVNGASMLYGAIREQLFSLTSRHKFGPIMLPSVSFGGYDPEPEEEPKAAENSEVREAPPSRRKASAKATK